MRRRTVLDGNLRSTDRGSACFKSLFAPRGGDASPRRRVKMRVPARGEAPVYAFFGGGPGLYKSGICGIFLLVDVLIPSLCTGAELPGKFPGMAVVGTVREVRLDAYGTLPLRHRAAMHLGSWVYRGEVLDTGARSFLRVHLKDDTHLTLGENASLRVDDLVFDPGRPGGRLFLNFLVGAFHYVSGRLPKRAIHIETPAVTIGIRGTELLIRVSPSGATTVGVVHGRAVIRSRESGRVERLNGGESATVSAKGESERPLQGVALTGDDGVDGYLDGVLRWRAEQKRPLSVDDEEHASTYDEGHSGDGDFGAFNQSSGDEARAPSRPGEERRREDTSAPLSASSHEDFSLARGVGEDIGHDGAMQGGEEEGKTSWDGGAGVIGGGVGSGGGLGGENEGRGGGENASGATHEAAHGEDEGGD